MGTIAKTESAIATGPTTQLTNINKQNKVNRFLLFYFVN